MFSDILRTWRPRLQNVVADANLLPAYVSELAQIQKEEDRLHIQALYLDAFWNKYSDPKTSAPIVLQEALRVIPTYEYKAGMNKVLFEAIDVKNQKLVDQLKQEEQERKAAAEQKVADLQQKAEEKAKRRQQDEQNRRDKEERREKEKQEKMLKALKEKEAEELEKHELEERFKKLNEQRQKELEETEAKRKLEAEQQKAQAAERARLKQKDKKLDKPAEALVETKELSEEEKQQRTKQKELKKQQKEREKQEKEEERQAEILAAELRAAEEKRLEEQRQEERQIKLAEEHARKLQEKKERISLKIQDKQNNISLKTQQQIAPEPWMIGDRRYTNRQLFNIVFAYVAFIAVWGTVINYILRNGFYANTPTPIGYTFSAGYGGMILKKYMQPKPETAVTVKAAIETTKTNQLK